MSVTPKRDFNPCNFRVKLRARISPFFLPVLLFLCPPARGAQPAQSSASAADGVAGSTVPAAQAAASAQSNLILNISKNSVYSRVGLDYSVRWDFSDLASFRPGLKTISSGIKAIYSWDITENTKFNYYGFKTNPWRIILADEKRDSGYGAAGAAGTAGQAAGGVVNRASPGSRKRLRLSASPLVDDLERNFYDNLREMLLRGSLKKLSPQWEKAGKDGRREFVRDVLSLGLWDAPLPGVEEGRGGLEYLAGGSDAGAGNKIHKSTGSLSGYRIRKSTSSPVP